MAQRRTCQRGGVGEVSLKSEQCFLPPHSPAILSARSPQCGTNAEVICIQRIKQRANGGDHALLLG